MTASRILIIAFVGLSTAAAFGQIPTPAPGTPDPNNPQPANSPQQAQSPDGPATREGAKPGGDAADNAQKPLEGPDIVDDTNATPEQRASAEYSGPAVLSRGISASEPMNPKNIKFMPMVGVEFMESSGLTGVAVQPNGQFSNSLSSGVSLTYSLTGERVMSRDIFSLAFTGNVNHYAQASNFDGTSDQLAFTWRHRLSRHLSFAVRESLQEYNNNSLLLSGSQLINSGVGTTLVTSSPTTEVFDGRVFSLFNEGSVTWAVSSRLSINLSGAGFLTRRASTSLYGDTGYQAGVDAAYRVTRGTTVGVYYSYTHFDYIGIYGGTDVNTVGLDYSIAFNPYTQLITRVGGSRLETTGLSSVALDPVLSLLLGSSSTVEAVYLKNFAPDISAQIRRKVPGASISLAYARGVTPGNGVILTSTSQSGTLGADFKMGRRWTANTTIGYTSLTGFGSTNQKYASYIGGASVTRKLIRQLDWHARFSYNRYTFDTTGFLRNNYTFTTGLIWTPGDIMEHLW